MDALSKKNENSSQKKSDGVVLSCLTTDSSSETSFCGSSSSVSTEEAKTKGSSSPAPLGWPILKATISKRSNSDEKENKHKSHLEDKKFTSIALNLSG